MKTLKKLLVAGLLCTTVLFTATACGEEFTDDYAVLLAPSVQQMDGEMYAWTPIENVTGYVVEINGEVKGIGNPITESLMMGKVCEYVLDTQALGLGVHTIRFASYVFDEKTGTTLSNWSKEFYVSNELPTTIESVEIYGDQVVLGGVEGHTVELIFNDAITATYTTPDKSYIGYQTISIDKFEFSAELIENVEYDVKAYVTNEFGKSEKYCETQYYYQAINQVKPAVGIIQDDQVFFYFNQELVNPFVSLKINQNEYSVALSGSYSFIDLYQVIDYLTESQVKEVFEALITEDCTFSLKLLNADGITVPTEYSNEIIMKAKGQETVDLIAMNGDVEFQEGIMFVYPNDFSGVFKDEVSVKVTVTLDDGTVVEVPTSSGYGYLNAYDFTKALGYGINVIKVEQTVNIADYQSTAEIFYYVASINPQVKSVSLGGNTVRWVSNGFNDGYKVQIVNGSGEVLQTFETKSNSWNVDEYESSGSFNVKVVPVLNGVDGTASPSLRITKTTAPSVNLITEEAEYFIVEGIDSSILQIEVYKTAGEEELVNKETLISSEEIMLIDKSSLYDLGSFEIRLKKLGNGVNTVDSKEVVAKFVVSDCLTFDVLDGEKIKVSGIDSKDLVVDGLYVDSTYVKEDWFDIKQYYADQVEQDHSITNVVVGDKIDSISTTSENILVKALTFNMNNSTCIATTPSGVYFDQDNKEFTWVGSSYNEYAYEIKDIINNTTKGSGTIVGTKLTVSSLSKGQYAIRIKLLGNGQVLNSYWNEFTYEVLGTSSVSTRTDIEVNKTELVITTSSSNVRPIVYYSTTNSSTYYVYETGNENEFYCYLGSDASRYDPYVTYLYIPGCDFHSSIEDVSRTLNVVSYQIYNYDVVNGGRSYNSFYRLSNEQTAQEYLRPVLRTNYNGEYVLGSSLYSSSYSTDYDYRYDYVIDTGYTPDSIIYKSNSYFDNDYYLVNLDYTNASNFQGVATSRYYTTIAQEKVKVDYAYVAYNKTLRSYLNSYLPLESGYDYYTDASCTEVLSETAKITSAITIYVGQAQA